MKPFDFDAGGEPPRPTVVLLHSSAGSSRQWSALVEALRPHFDVRAVDFHGHGTQPEWRGAAPLTLADEVALVEPILREAGRVHLVGHSYGGAVALKAAQLHPHAVRSLVVYEPVMFRWLSEEDPNSDVAREVVALAAGMRESLNAGDDLSAAERFLTYWSGAGAWNSMPVARRQASAARMRSVLSHFDALAAETLTAASFRRLGSRMLCLSGSRTVASTRRISAILRATLPHGEHQMLVGMGHMGPITHADEVNRRLAMFLGRYAAGHRSDAMAQAA
jgi:pimeloyl-ACP methyl ester carboxylesterase